MKSIYLASAYSRKEEMRGIRDVLEAMGYTVTSRWIDQDEGTSDIMGLGPADLDQNPERGAPHALMDMADIQMADTMVQFTGVDGRGGRHVEFGMAHILGKFIIIVGPREHVFHGLPGIDQYPDIEQFIINLRKFS